jgi:large subunit ribosomal protein L25
MERIQLEASKREVVGKKVRFIRRKGATPANMYGHGLESMALAVDSKKLKQTLARAGKTDLISLNVSDSAGPVMVLVREVQKDPLTREVLHVDFYQVKMTEKIKADIPLVFVGDAPALKIKNVTLLHLLDYVHIEALPDHLPHNLQVDISKLENIDQSIFVKDIPLSAEISLLSDPEQIVIKAVETHVKIEEPVVAPEAKAEEGVEAEGEAVAAGEAPEGEAKPAGKEKPAAKEKSSAKEEK